MNQKKKLEIRATLNQDYHLKKIMNFQARATQSTYEVIGISRIFHRCCGESTIRIRPFPVIRDLSGITVITEHPSPMYDIFYCPICKEHTHTYIKQIINKL
jgi:hypothetical protein